MLHTQWVEDRRWHTKVESETFTYLLDISNDLVEQKAINH